MFRKINIILLGVLFAILLVAVVFVEFLDIQKRNRSFRKDLIEVTFDEVSSIEIKAKASDGKTMKLIKDNNNEWEIEAGNKKYRADQSIAASLVEQLNEMKPQSVVAIGKDRWNEYEVSDSLGTHVRLLSGAKVLADIIIGKFSFSQPRTMTSYVRLADSKEVYGVNGMIGMSFNRNVDSFRDRTIINSSTSDWVKLTFTYPADSSFSLLKIDEKWMVNDQPADSAVIIEYFNSISRLSDSKFSDSELTGTFTHILKIEGNNNMAPVEVKGNFVDSENFYVESNQNKGTVFNNPETAKKIFVPFLKFFE